MDKKFVSAEEAVAQFGLDPAAFQHVVDEGKLRALADRGTWKYRRDEIEGLIQKGLLKAKHPSGVVQQQTLSFETPKTGAGPDELSFIELDEEALAEGAATMKQQPGASDEPTTPSEVYLVSDDEPAAKKQAPSSRPPLADSVSDVKLVGEPEDEFGVGIEPMKTAGGAGKQTPPAADSSSAFDLGVVDSSSAFDLSVASDSSKFDQSSIIVHADDAEKPASDSDVKVVKPSLADSDSDVVLAGGTEHVVAAKDSGISLSDGSGSDSDVKIADSGISLEHTDSGISLESGDSGISLGASSVVSAGDSAFVKDDSGITLESSSVVPGLDSAIDKSDSGITLDVGDSGLTLETAADSGISLEAGDSGITLGGHDSGIRLDAQTGRPKRPRRPAKTEVEIDQLQSQEFVAAGPNDTGVDQTAMLILDDDDAASKETLPPAKGKGMKAAGLSGAFDSAAVVEDLEIVEDLDAGELDVDAVEDESLEDILEASDEAFTAGESAELSGEGISSVSAGSSVAGASTEPSWGIWAVLPIAACALLLAVNGLILWEGVSTMWTGATPTLTGVLVDSLGG